VTALGGGGGGGGGEPIKKAQERKIIKARRFKGRRKRRGGERWGLGAHGGLKKPLYEITPGVTAQERDKGVRKV